MNTPHTTPPTEQIQLALKLAQTDFRVFLRLAFRILNPNTKLNWNWHLEYLCWMLQSSLPTDHPAYPSTLTPEQRNRNLIINVPPRSLKTETVSVAFPAFCLGHNPSFQAIIASFSTRASANINTKLARLLKHPLYEQIFPAPDTPILEKATESHITTTKGGQCLATSPQGTVTSFGADTLLIDDLLSPEQAFSPTELTRANRFFFNTLYPSRLNDKTNGSTIVIAQRLHEGDLPGELLRQNPKRPPSEQFTPVILPAIHPQTEDPQTYYFYNTSHTQNPDDLLHPTRDTRESLEAIKTDPERGPYTFASQYMQNPAPTDGGIINLQQLQSCTYDPANLPPPTQALRITHSWDTAIKTTSRSDFSVCTTWLETKTHHYLLDVIATRLEYPELYQLVISQANKTPHPTVILIEDKASGQQLIQDLRKDTTLPIKAITPTPQQNKLTRAATSIPAFIESSSLLLPNDHQQRPWWEEFERQCMYFPNGKHDDIVDSISQYLNFVKSSFPSEPRIRTL